MRNFSQVVKESRKNFDSESLLQSEVTSYINKVKRILPQSVQDLIALTTKYGLLSASDIEPIRKANKNQLKKISDEKDIPLGVVETIYSLLKSIGRSFKLLPQYQTEAERAALEAGRLSMDDLTIDLTTQTGRNAAAKMYTPLVLKIANQYVGKSRLDRPSLISAGMEGLTGAMNDWDRSVRDDGKKTTFKTYASYRIQQAILNDINANGHTLSGTNWYAVDKYGAAMLDAMSLDGLNNRGDEFDNDRLLALGEDPLEPDSSLSQEEENWKDMFKLLDNHFSSRDMDIFYRYFGLGPYHGKRQKSKDIAKDYGMSEGNIRNSIINKIIKYLKTNTTANKIMAGIRDMYTESLLKEMIGISKEEIRESLYQDNTYIMLEEITRWNNKQVLIQTVNLACDKLDLTEAKFIYDCLMKGEEFISKNLKGMNKKILVYFLSEVYPSENMIRKSNAELVNYMNELIEAAKMMKVDW